MSERDGWVAVGRGGEESLEEGRAALEEDLRTSAERKERRLLSQPMADGVRTEFENKNVESTKS